MNNLSNYLAKLLAKRTRGERGTHDLQTSGGVSMGATFANLGWCFNGRRWGQIPCPWMLRLIIGQRTATAAERPALFFLRGLFHHLYRGRVQLIGAALPVEGLIAASHHRNCGLGRRAWASLGNRGDRA